MQDACDLGRATNEEANRLISWKKYRVMLMRVNMEEVQNIKWPETLEE
ncbi:MULTISPECIES: tail fiber assembly protein [Pantoea]|nr:MULTISPECIES: tail fiber assembly protein [Pantoea]MDU6433134.1 tail fiber assembly protein [Pantoea sp.]